MPTSNAVVTPGKMELSPMRVTFDGVDLGGTLSNVVINYEYDKAEIKADQFGSTVLDRRVSGLKITVTTELAEVQIKDNWKVVFPNAQLVSTGTKSVIFVNAMSESDLDKSKILLLHPLSKADGDLTEDFKFLKAAADGKSSITYGPAEQGRIKVTWNIYPDTSVIPARFMIFGDPTIGVVNASAAAPVYVGTGNGAISAVTVYNGFTKTETITIEVVGVPGTDDSNWHVSGSLSGPLGLLQLNGGPGNSANFVSNPITFTITDGSVDFVIGDKFTIATTAANYA